MPLVARPLQTSGRVPDRALVARMMTGDESAYRELLARYRSTVYATAYAILTDPETVDRVVAETFEEARRMAREFLATRGSVSGWLTHLTRLRLAGLLEQRPTH